MRASVADGQGQRASAQILDLTVTEDGVRMRLGFPVGQDVVLAVGRSVDVTLESDVLGTTRTYSARILRRHELDDRQVYEATLDVALGFELELTVLPRGAVRVRPKVGEQVEVSLVHPGVSRYERFPLVDASHTGLSLRMPCSAERTLFKASSLKLRLYLPGVGPDPSSGEPSAGPSSPAPAPSGPSSSGPSMLGRIRTRVLAADGGGIEYGIELDQGRDPEQAEGSAALAAWVERRYAELISGMRTLHRSA